MNTTKLINLMELQNLKSVIENYNSDKLVLKLLEENIINRHKARFLNCSYSEYKNTIETMNNNGRFKELETLKNDILYRYTNNSINLLETRKNGTYSDGELVKRNCKAMRTKNTFKSVYKCKFISIVSDNYNVYNLNNGYEKTTDYLKTSFIKTVRFNKMVIENDKINDVFCGLFLYASTRYDDSLNTESKNYLKFTSFNHAFFYSLRIVKMLSIKLDILEVETLVNYLIYPHKRKTLKTYFTDDKLAKYSDRINYLNRIECKHDFNRIVSTMANDFSSKYMLELVNNYSQKNCKDIYKKAISRIFQKYGELFNVSFNVLSKEEKSDFLYKIYKRCRYNEYLQYKA